VFPTSAAYDTVNQPCGNVKIAGKIFLAFPICPTTADFTNGIRRQFAATLSFSLGLSALGSTVPVVVSPCSKEKMAWIYASRLVASVADA
jgi:hypothetical protein